MKRAVIVIVLGLVVTAFAVSENRNGKMQDEVLRTEGELSRAIVRNDAEAVERYLTDDWIIVDPDGGIIDKARFLGVIKSGALTHETMESEETSVRIYGNTAIVTALTMTKGTFSGQGFTTQERATDVFVKLDGQWRCAFSQLTRFTKK